MSYLINFCLFVLPFRASSLNRKQQVDKVATHADRSCLIRRGQGAGRHQPNATLTDNRVACSAAPADGPDGPRLRAATVRRGP
eukprot:6564169-Prymnesium_polylepis.1